MQKDEDGGAELQWESPIFMQWDNMVEEGIGTNKQVCFQEKANLAVQNLMKSQIYNEGEKKFGARI